MRKFKGGFVCAMVMGVCAIMTAQTQARDLFIDPIFGSAENTGATATVSLSFSQSGSDDWLTIVMTNTTPAGIGGGLTALGLELPDFIAGVVGFAPGGTHSYFDTLQFNDNVSPGSLNAPGGYDVMITSDGNFEGGSPDGSPGPGASATVVLNLGDTGMSLAALQTGFSSFYASATHNIVIARFQGLTDGGSDKVLGGIPEPATLSMLLVAGAFAVRRRRSR